MCLTHVSSYHSSVEPLEPHTLNPYNSFTLDAFVLLMPWIALGDGESGDARQCYVRYDEASEERQRARQADKSDRQGFLLVVVFFSSLKAAEG